jgi:polyphosphate kinase
MRPRLVEMIQEEARNAQAGIPSGICIKINSLQDKKIIDELYKASQAGVPIRLIVRGICCLRPQRKGLSENITVRSIVGDFLEHTRIFYFHNAGNPKIYGGSADVMVRSFDRRIESLFEFIKPKIRQQVIHILWANLQDNVNTYEMQEDGSFIHCSDPTQSGKEPFNIQEVFFNVTEREVMAAKLFEDSGNQIVVEKIKPVSIGI